MSVSDLATLDGSGSNQQMSIVYYFDQNDSSRYVVTLSENQAPTLHVYNVYMCVYAFSSQAWIACTLVCRQTMTALAIDNA